MNFDSILQDLKSERERIDKAIRALEVIGNHVPKRGRRSKAAAAPKKRARPHISAKARAKLSRLMKQRWAARKKAGKSKLG